MEPKFKVGDKVLITDAIKEWICCTKEMWEYIGKTFTIKEIQKSTSSSDGYIYTLKEIKYRYHWDCRGFQLVENTEEKEPESKYNIGDVVEILPRIHNLNDYSHAYVDPMCAYAGKKYTIIGKVKRNHKRSRIKDDGFVYTLAETGDWNWDSSMFKKAEQEKFLETKESIKRLEPAVGDISIYKEKRYICIEDANKAVCSNCVFLTNREGCKHFQCASDKRKDNKEVYFQEILDTPSIGLGLTLSPVPWIDVEDKKDSGKSIIEYIMGLNKKPNYKLKFKL